MSILSLDAYKQNSSYQETHAAPVCHGTNLKSINQQRRLLAQQRRLSVMHELVQKQIRLCQSNFTLEEKELKTLIKKELQKVAAGVTKETELLHKSLLENFYHKNDSTPLRILLGSVSESSLPRDALIQAVMNDILTGKHRIAKLVLKKVGCKPIEIDRVIMSAALALGSESQVSQLLNRNEEKRAQLLSWENNSTTSLHRAIKGGNEELIRVVLDVVIPEFFHTKDWQGNTPLHVALEENRDNLANIIKLMREAVGSDAPQLLQDENSKGQNALQLFFAQTNSKLQTMYELLACLPKVKSAGDYDLICNYAKGYQYGFYCFIEWLEQEIIDSNKLTTTIISAISEELEKDKDAQLNERKSHFYQLLKEEKLSEAIAMIAKVSLYEKLALLSHGLVNAVENGHLNRAAFLLEQAGPFSPVLVVAKNNFVSLLYQAVYRKQIKMAHLLLLNAGPSLIPLLSLRNFKGQSCLHIAIQQNNPRMVTLLLFHAGSARMKILMASSSFGLTAACMARTHGHSDLACLLVNAEEPNSVLDTKVLFSAFLDAEDLTRAKKILQGLPIMQKLSYLLDYPIVECIKDYPQRANSLHVACLENNLVKARFILDQTGTLSGELLCLPNEEGKLPLDIALIGIDSLTNDQERIDFQERKLPLVTLLLEHSIIQMLDKNYLHQFVDKNLIVFALVTLNLAGEHNPKLLSKTREDNGIAHTPIEIANAAGHNVLMELLFLNESTQILRKR